MVRIQYKQIERIAQQCYFASVAAIRACYPDVSSMVMFHFDPPVGYPDRNERSANHARHVAA